MARIQGRPVERIHVENGRGERETFRVAEFGAYYRRVRERFLAAIDERPATYGWPVDHCSICDFQQLCRRQREVDDHLTLVAGMRRTYAEALIESRVTTLEALGSLPAGTPVPTDAMRQETFDGIRQQAELQLRGRTTGEHCWELLPEHPDRGFRLLPPPDVGDVWLDLEGHPFYETSRGLEYLFGYCFRDEDGLVRYEALWGKDREAERVAFERFVDWIVERRRRYPNMHVYHYAAYERTALTRLMGEHGTRELAIDAFLRDEVLVDLYRVVKQAIRASVESYSIKAIEELYGFVRHAEVAGGDESIVRFEEWMETGDDALLEAVERYNEEDCRSTVALHEWLLSLRPPELPWREPPGVREPTEVAVERDAEREAVRIRLLHEARLDSPERLLANLVDYHKREQRPQWWEWFRWPQLDDEELVRNRTAIGALAWDGAPPGARGQQQCVSDALPARRSTSSTIGARIPTRGRASGSADRRRRRHRHGAPRRRCARTSRCRAG